MEARFTPLGVELNFQQLKNALGVQGWRRLSDSLTIREKPQPGAPPGALSKLRNHACYKIEEGRIILPRRLAHVLATHNVIKPLTDPPGWFGGRRRSIRRLTPESCEFVIPLYDYQQAYVEHIVEKRLSAEMRRSGRGQVYIQVDTGKGKTRMALAIAALLRVPACFIAPTRALQADGVAEAETVLPKLKAVAYSNVLERAAVKGGVPPPRAENVDLMFCVVNTARKKPPDFFEGFGIIFLDEAHEYHSPQSSALLWNAQAPCIIGLSATPGERPDMMDRVVPQFLGPPLPLHGVVPAELIEDIDFEGRVREVWYEGDPRHTNAALGPSIPVCVIGRMIQDPCRFTMVAAEVERLLYLHETLPSSELEGWGLGIYPPTGEMRQHCVFVFAEHRDYLPALREVLSARLGEGFVYCPDFESTVRELGGDGSVILRGGATTQERQNAKHSRVVLTTYGFSRRGISLGRMTALVAATPRRNGQIQILGRICRMTKDEATRTIKRVVVDIRDTATSLAAQSSERRKAYQRKGWPVYYIKSSYKDYSDPRAKAPPTPSEKPLPRRQSRAGDQSLTPSALEMDGPETEVATVQDLLK